MRLSHAWLVSLKATIFVQRRLAWIRDVFGVSNFLIVGFADIRPAQVPNPFGRGVHNHHILVTVGFLLAAVVQRLFLNVFWPLATPFRAINDECGWFALTLLMRGKLAWIAFRDQAQLIQRLLEHRQQMVNPIVRSRLAQVEDFTEQHLQWIGLLIHQGKQQFLFQGIQGSLASTSHGTLPSFPGLRPTGWMQPLIGLPEGWQQDFELLGCYPGQGQEFPSVPLDLVVSEHAYSVTLFRIKSNESKRNLVMGLA